jgi:ubiquinone/menaquinone biosynthesis C-methylase UbiE
VLRRRAELIELLDRHVTDPRELATNLCDLARLNRLPGGARASAAAIRGLVADDPDVSILDVGGGIGDMALRFARQGWRTVLVDAHPQVVAAARIATAEEPRIRVEAGDARALTFADGAFDVVHSSLLLHHLDSPDAVRALREMARVARCGVVVNDLRRGILPLVATGVAVAVLGRCRATRADGIASVRRAYDLGEVDALLAEAGLKVARRTNGLMPRVVTTAVAQ